jgi:hypothetical protein
VPNWDLYVIIWNMMVVYALFTQQNWWDRGDITGISTTFNGDLA